MTQRPYFETITERLNEPRKFIQIIEGLVRLAYIPRPVLSPSVGIGRRRRYFIIRGDKTYTLQGQEVK